VHPNIAQPQIALQVNKPLVMVMEFVEGLTFAQHAEQGGNSQRRDDDLRAFGQGRQRISTLDSFLDEIGEKKNA
jgi:hypothetical protein